MLGFGRGWWGYEEMGGLLRGQASWRACSRARVSELRRRSSSTSRRTALDETAPGAITGSLLAARSEAILRRCHEALVNAATPYGLLKGTISSFEGDGT